MQEVAAETTGKGAGMAGTESSSAEDQLSALLKEAKKFRASLRTERKERPQLHSQSGELARKGLRSVYLKLLFNYPFSSRTRGVDVNIWTETSHFDVQANRSLLNYIEIRLKGANQDNESGPLSPTQQQQLTQRYLRVAHTFRTFLQNEETFWREMVGRVARVFDVEEAKPGLRSLGIACDKVVAVELSDDEWAGMGTEEGGDLAQSKVAANKQRLMEIIYKGLVCCGDLARYSEVYKGEIAARQPSSLRGGARGGRGGLRGARGGARGGLANRLNAQMGTTSEGKVARDFTKSAQCYEQARALVPSNGNPSNQIAVLATYNGDIFSAVYHYYRALCTVDPFEKAKHNIEGVLRRAMDKWQAQGEGKAVVGPSSEVEKRRASLMDDLVALHAYYYLSSYGSAPVLLSQQCQEVLSSLLVEKALGADVIVQIVVAAIASLWTRRLWRGESGKDEGAPSTGISAEHEILLHLVGLIKVLTEVGAAETREAMEIAKRDPLSDPAAANETTSIARNITAVLRRMLPALRIASKWLKTHVEYVERSKEQHQSGQETGKQTEAEGGGAQKGQLAEAVDQLWSRYVDFINVIRFAFPFERLPKLGMLGQSGMTSLNFEEDRDMRGFVPMKKAMLVEEVGGARDVNGENQLHPNEEHLIRIADLLIDAKVVAESNAGPVAFDDDRNHFYVKGAVRDKSQTDSSLAKSSAVAGDQSLSRSEDSKWENGSESTEDAVDLAMRAVDERRRALGTAAGRNTGSRDEESEDDDDDDGEIILIPSAGGLVARSQAKQPSAPTKPASNGESAAMQAQEMTSTDEPLTAQHLLLQVINGSKAPARADQTRAIPSPSPSTPQPHLLFGGITSSSSQGSFGALSHHGGAWDGNEAMQFMNQQQHQHQHHQYNPLAQPAFPSASPWGPPTRPDREEAWR